MSKEMVYRHVVIDSAQTYMIHGLYNIVYFYQHDLLLVKHSEYMRVKQ